MLEKFKESWKQFKESEPGHRFQDRYNRRQEESHGRFDAGKIFNMAAGIAVTLAGILFIPAPGPGSMIIFLGLGLIGCEFLPFARFLDRAEVKLRAAVDEIKDLWKRSSIPVKILISLFILGLTGAVGYGAYELFFSNSRQ